MRAIGITVLNKDFEIIGRYDSIKIATSNHHHKGLPVKLDTFNLNKLKTGIATFRGVLFIRTDLEHKIPTISKEMRLRSQSKIESDYNKRKTIIVNAWKNTVFVLEKDSNMELNITDVVHGYYGSKFILAKKEGISDGCLKGYVSRALSFLNQDSKRNKFYIKRADFFKFNP